MNDRKNESWGRCKICKEEEEEEEEEEEGGEELQAQILIRINEKQFFFL